MDSLKIAELESKIKQLERKLEAANGAIALAAVIGPKVRNISHLVAQSESAGAFKENGQFYYKGEYLSAAEYSQRIEADENYAVHFKESQRPIESIPASENPWRKESLNLTKQMRLLRENPALARKLREAAKGGS
ncbi:hypothetical protein [Synechococcus sp. BDU 130192]|uniref:hypothetical protein n=1 Tax=Synechococcus sp. BDU 130192 TaxID=2042059 RepID=UPI000C06FE75|nr:hypothetical protein [Synechococcus sp. BDU 130192]